MAFDPDKYLKEKTKEAFNPDQYLKEKGVETQPEQTEKPNPEEDSFRTLKDILIGAAKGSLASKIPGAVAYLYNLPSGTEEAAKAYRETQAPIEKAEQEAEERSPIASTGGQLFGALAPAIATGGLGLAKGAASIAGEGLAGRALGSAAEGALLGGIAGGTESKANLIGGSAEDQEQAIKDILSGATTGAVAGPILGAAAEGIKASVPENISKAFNLGLEGKPVYTEAGAAALGKEKEEVIRNALEPIQNAMKTLYGQRQDILNKAAQKGIKVDVAGTLEMDRNALARYLDENGKLIPNRRKVTEILSHFTKDGDPISPDKISVIKDQLSNLSSSLYNIDPSLSSTINTLRSTLGEEVESSIPELAEFNAKYKTFMDALPDTLLSQGTKDLNKVSYGTVNKPQEALYKKIDKLLQGLSENEPEQAALKEKLTQNLKDLGEEHLKSIGFGTTEEFEKTLEKGKSLYKTLGITTPFEFNPTKPWSSLTGTAAPKLASALGGVVEQGKKTTEQLVNYVGKPLQTMSDKLYDATPEQLKQVAGKLIDNPITASLGHALNQSLDNPTHLTKNAILFSILQNPKAREALKE